jgi:hypothetical protein
MSPSDSPTLLAGLRPFVGKTWHEFRNTICSKSSPTLPLHKDPDLGTHGTDYSFVITFAPTLAENL